MDTTWSSILTTGPRLSGDVPMTVADHLMSIAAHHRPVSNRPNTSLADRSNFIRLLPTGRTTGPRLVADQNKCDCNIFGGPMLADGLWWSAPFLVVGGRQPVVPSV